VSGEHDDGRLRVEEWEMEMARRIAGSFRRTDEELRAVLFVRLAELKAKTRNDIRDWRGFLAQSLYNAAKNFVRHEDVIRGRQQSLDFVEDGNESSSLLEQLAAPPEPEEQFRFSDIRKRLTPEMRELADLLMENEGNVSAVAAALDRPRKTVDYWIAKLRTLLRKRGLEP
jgi:DNA-directed RNA polymerase specialized sigma24 family protein